LADSFAAAWFDESYHGQDAQQRRLRLPAQYRSGEVDQGEAGFRILALSQIARRLDQDHFQGRPDTCLDQVTDDDTAVRFAENRMEMRQDLDLLVDGDFLVLLGLRRRNAVDRTDPPGPRRCFSL
jgi:hypothetical protein